MAQPVELAYSAAERHPVVEAFSAHCLADPRPCLDIALGDEMFDYALDEQHHHRGLALLSYLRSGLTAWQSLEQVLEWRFGSLDRVARVLEFAAGYGRVTRFLLTGIPRERVTVAEISASALEFQRRRFEVATRRSAPRPEALDLDGGYSAVLVLSLFTHLPETLFAGWLARLWEAVGPGGVMAFSVNDEAVMFPGRLMPASGLYFESVSENQSLAVEEYGSTWVTEAFVRKAVAKACPGAAQCLRVARGLWHFQDLYVVTRDEAPSSPLAVELPPEGYLDTCIQHHDGSVVVAGWAIDRQRPDDRPEIRVVVEGVERGRARASEPRPDLAEILGEPFLRSGWVCRLAPPAGDRFRPDDQLMVIARSDAGRETVLHASQLEGADLTRRVAGAREEIRDANLRLRAEVAELRRRVAWMERSRFWKLRNAWFAVRPW